MTARASGRVAVLACAASAVLGAAAAERPPAGLPLGVPAPEFGLTQTAPAPPSPWTAPVAGFYYVDAAHPAATDSGNPYGSSSRPRRTIPLALPAGASVHVHGAYGQSHVSPNVIEASGTQSAPVWITGSGPTSVTRPLHIHGTYFVVERLTFRLADAGQGTFKIISPTSHGVLRHCDVGGNKDGGGVVVSYNKSFGGTVSHVVLWDNKIHDNGNVLSPHDDDDHAIGVGPRVSYLWVLDNVLSESSGDGIQINAESADEQAGLHHVFVGRNLVFRTRQAGLFTKQATHVVFSQNRIHDVINTSWSPSKGLGYQYAPEDVWFIFNEVWSCTYGIYAGSDSGMGTGKNVYVVGNVIHGIHHDATQKLNPKTAWSNAGIMLAGGTNRFVVGNTLHDVDNGISCPDTAGSLYVVGNVVAGVAVEGRHLFVEMGPVARASTLHHNLLDPPARIGWGSAGTAGLLAVQGVERGSPLEADPQFVDAAAGDLRPRESSPAAGAGVDDPVYALYEKTFGVAIDRDARGRARPRGAARALGALEP